MKAFAIVLKDDKLSQDSFMLLKESSLKAGNDFKINEFEAVTHSQANALLVEKNIQWNYPWEGSKMDFATGLLKSAYPTQMPSKRIACALSHYTLWEQCATGTENFLILEHDSYFLHNINHMEEQINKLPALVVGINSPMGATRRAVDFYEQVMGCKDDYMRTPWIDDRKIPQGIAGNSAYIIKPAGAQALLDLVKEFGLWPNDAIMCKQLMPELWVSTTFYTRVQGTTSTTSL